MIFEFLTRSPQQTRKAGRILAQELFKTKTGQKARVIGLIGDLGGGKTTFLQGFAKGLGIKQKITSPTFVIMRRFNGFYHIDCYRLKKPRELNALGFKKIVSQPQNIVAVEWADRVKKIMPKHTIWLHFRFINENKRKIMVE